MFHFTFLGLQLPSRLDAPDRDESRLPYRELSTSIGVPSSGHYMSCVRFVDDRTLLTSSSDGSITLWDMEARVPKTVFMGHEAEVLALALPHNGGKGMDGSTVKSSQGTVGAAGGLRHTRNPSVLSGEQKGGITVTELDHDPPLMETPRIKLTELNNNLFVTGSADETLRIWDMRLRKPVVVFRGISIYLCFEYMRCISILVNVWHSFRT